MCGAISWPYDAHYQHLYREFFSSEQIRIFEQEKRVIFAFWDPVPLLPVRMGGDIRLYSWGNRDKQLLLPKTGWARRESLQAHKWDYLRPKVVLIPASHGCEKDVWFPLSSEILGVLIKKEHHLCVYMITEAASKEYQEITGHDRMPRCRGLPLHLLP